MREEEPVTTATLSAVVDMSPDPVHPPPPPVAAVFQSPPPQSQLVGPITTPISSPLRSAAIAQVRSRSVETSTNRDTPRIGVAALPNVDFQGFGGGTGFLPQIATVVAAQAPPPQPRQQSSSSARSNSRHSRRRRRGGHHEEV